MSPLPSTHSPLLSQSVSGPRRRVLSLDQTRGFVEQLLGDSFHANRVRSIGNAVGGVLNAALLSIHAIGQAYASLARITPKAGVKQVDRLLSNSLFDEELVQKLWIRFVLGVRTEVVLAMDWTDFDDDDHTTLCVHVVSSHGRATPLAWKTVPKSSLAGRRTALEHEMVLRLDECIEEGVCVELLADRGFGDQKLYDLLGELGWDYIIRFRGNIHVESANGEVRMAAAWVPASSRARLLKGAHVTKDRALVPAIVVVHDRKMKECWCLATSRADWAAATVVKHYGRRFSIEETFRDVKDLHFGLGLRATHIRNARRRDRLLMLVAIAHALLTLLGAASEASGLDRYLKVNTARKRTHSLFRQGCYWYAALPEMRDDWLLPLMAAYDKIIREHAVFAEIFGLI
jgi:hypothetical protein